MLLVVLAVLAGSAYFADQLTAEPTYRPFEGEQDNEVLAADDTTVTLRDEGFVATDDGTSSPETTRWGLQLPAGRHVVLTEVLSRDPLAGTVTWGWTDATGVGPRRGEQVRVDEFVEVGDPNDVELLFREVAMPGEDGPLPTWVVPATTPEVRGTVIFVHGRGATRAESLRFLPTLTAEGFDVLVPTYRGDDGAPRWPDGRVRFGIGAWRDLEGVVADAVTEAGEYAGDPQRPLVLFGVSMGGAIAGQFLDRSELADRVDAVVLDSPVLSLDDLLVLQGELNGVPGWASPALLPVVQWIADLRYGLESSALEQVEADGTFAVPTLLVHGDDDAFVPVEGTVRFAAERIDGVTAQRPEQPELLVSDGGDTRYLRVPTAGHARTWNVASQRYAAALSDFLRDVG